MTTIRYVMHIVIQTTKRRLFDTVHRAIHKLQLQKYQYENNALNVKLYTNKHERNDNLAIKAFVCFLVWFSSIFEFRLE